MSVCLDLKNNNKNLIEQRVASSLDLNEGGALHGEVRGQAEHDEGRGQHKEDHCVGALVVQEQLGHYAVPRDDESGCTCARVCVCMTIQGLLIHIQGLPVET